MNIEAAKQINLVDFLRQLNIPTAKIKGNDYWYKSPLREERTASFKVDNRKNLWYDFGTGEGGSIIDFGMRYYSCNISEVLEILDSKVISFRPQIRQKQKPVEAIQAVYKIMKIGSIKSASLLAYIRSRGIEIAVAQSYCKEISVQNQKTLKTFEAIGFPNINGGWELKTPHFKSCIAPKDVSLFDEQKNTLAIVEGFFDFLSAKQHHEHLLSQATNWLVLNSVSMLEKAKPHILQNKKIYLLLDNDKAGKNSTIKLQDYCIRNNIQVENLASTYGQCKDINEWLVKEEISAEQKTKYYIKPKSKNKRLHPFCLYK